MSRSYPVLGMPIQSGIHYNTHTKWPVNNYQQQTFTNLNQHAPPNRRNNAQNYFKQSHKKTVHTNNSSIPAQYFFITRKQYCIVKCLHHIAMLKKGIPKTWKNWKNNIVNNLRLAFHNEDSKSTIQSLSQQYFDNLLSASLAHYNDTLESARVELQQQSHQMDSSLHSESIKLITKWAHNQLGNKLSPNTLKEALDMIKSCYSNSHPPTTQSYRPNQRAITNVTENNLTVTINNSSFVHEETTSTVTPSPTEAIIHSQSPEPPEEARSRLATATSVKQSKAYNSSRFFVHSDTYDEDDVLQNMLEAQNCPLPQSQSTSSQQAGSQLSQSSILSYTDGSQQHNSDFVIHKLSQSETAKKIQSSCVDTILLGDHNWEKYIPPESVSSYHCYVCSAKVTAIRSILEMIKTKVNVKNLILCFSSNNFDSATCVSLLGNINSALIKKFPNTNVFICLAGICKSFSPENARSLEAINIALRNKSDKYVLINPPDNFKVDNGHTFHLNTRSSFFNSLNSFLC